MQEARDQAQDELLTMSLEKLDRKVEKRLLPEDLDRTTDRLQTDRAALKTKGAGTGLQRNFKPRNSAICSTREVSLMTS